MNKCELALCRRICAQIPGKPLLYLLGLNVSSRILMRGRRSTGFDVHAWNSNSIWLADIFFGRCNLESLLFRTLLCWCPCIYPTVISQFHWLIDGHSASIICCWIIGRIIVIIRDWWFHESNYECVNLNLYFQFSKILVCRLYVTEESNSYFLWFYNWRHASFILLL